MKRGTVKLLFSFDFFLTKKTIYSIMNKVRIKGMEG